MALALNRPLTFQYKSKESIKSINSIGIRCSLSSLRRAVKKKFAPLKLFNSIFKKRKMKRSKN